MWTRKLEQPIIIKERAKEMFNMAKNQKSYTPELKKHHKVFAYIEAQGYDTACLVKPNNNEYF